MPPLHHESAHPSHYDKEATHYDKFNEKNSAVINRTIETILHAHKVKTLLDLTCGTGSQVFWLTKCGFEIIGSDFNEELLKVARGKAKKEKIDLKFYKGDMRTTNLGRFDAVLTIFNAVGHLTKQDFEKAMQTINRNLKEGGLYIFDIFNLSFLEKGDHITSLTIDWLERTGHTKVRTIQYSTIDDQGVLASYTTTYEQLKNDPPKSSQSVQTLQVYRAKQLQEMLQRTGFQVVQHSAIDGSKFLKTKSERLLTVAKKVRECDEEGSFV